jgi:hypothetical protein
MEHVKSLSALLIAGLIFTACVKKEQISKSASISGDMVLGTNSISSDTLLKVYKNPNMVGPSGGLSIQRDLIYRSWSGGTNYAILNSDFDNDIESFYLPKGYQVVFADNSDGTGESICYEAANSAININLPTRLKNNISFIRFMQIKSAKKIGMGQGNWTTINTLGSSWFYDWGNSKYSIWNSDQMYYQMYTPMAWGKGAYDQTHIDDYIAKKTVDHILGFNEPDNLYQSNTTAIDAITYYANLQKTGLRMGSPATQEGHAYGTGQWLTTFMSLAAQQHVRVDFVAIHWYDWGNWSTYKVVVPDPQYVLLRFKAYVQNVHNGLSGRLDESTRSILH